MRRCKDRLVPPPCRSPQQVDCLHSGACKPKRCDRAPATAENWPCHAAIHSNQLPLLRACLPADDEPTSVEHADMVSLEIAAIVVPQYGGDLQRGAAKTQPARRVSSRLAVHTYLHLLLRALRSNEDRLLDQLVRLFELGDALTRLSLRRCGGRATTTKKKARPCGRAFARCGACFRSCAGTARPARGRWPGRSQPPSLLLPRSGCC